jgi:AcrR family transcriptional regulator
MLAAGKRLRRRPEEARQSILDAAEEQIAAAGPAALRLQDVARVAGVSHPTILHHFGSREGLIKALNERALEELKNAVLEQAAESGEESIRLTFAAHRNGLAQRILWLLQSSAWPPRGSRLRIFEEIVRKVHEARVRNSPAGTKIDISDTRAVVHLITIAAFGDAVIGPVLRQSEGGSEASMRGRFEKWFCHLVEFYMHSTAGPSASPDCHAGGQISSPNRDVPPGKPATARPGKNS